MAFIDSVGRVPYDSTDTTRNWVETSPGMRSNGKLKPSLHLRFATDTNYIRNQTMQLYGDFPRGDAQSKAVVNIALPGQRMMNILNWQVQEQSDQTVQTASFEALNCLLKTSITTTLSQPLNGDAHSNNIIATYVQNSLNTLSKVAGNRNVARVLDPTSANSTADQFYFFEDKVLYREFDFQFASVVATTGFPDPAIPNDDDNDVPDSRWPAATNSVGSYFLLIGNEIVRVCALSGSTFFIPPGGRGVAGTNIDFHPIGTKVTLLNYGPVTTEWVGMGYLNVDDYAPQSGILRPGSCFASYEGYGDLPNRLYHDFNTTWPYTFTGYWFVTGVEPSIAEDGVPRIRVDLKNVGQLLDQQKITPDLVQRLDSKLGNWKLRDRGDPTAPPQSIFGAADHTRNIPGDWVDFNHWDPTLKDSYPLALKVELAQHKEFFNHMQDTNMGTNCEICQDERKAFVQAHPNLAKNPIAIQKSMGRHIYKQSIRVMQTENGPLCTYIRLMATLAAAAWEHPAINTDLAQKFTKIPGRLYNNIRNIDSGMCYNGQIDVYLASNDRFYDWSVPTYDDNQMIGNYKKLMCPFEATYDKAPFSQPMLDLADTNGMTFWINREGYPVFLPRHWSFRPTGAGYRDLYDRSAKWLSQMDTPISTVKSWFLTYGSSITSYSHSIQPDSVLTQVWVTATTAFDSSFTTATAGTGFGANGRRILYSALGGNREGLAMTSGIQQVDTITLDNQVLGFDWDTQPANWGVQQVTSDGVQVLNPLPALYGGESPRKLGDKGHAVARIRNTINFFLIRHYLLPLNDPDHNGKQWFEIPEGDEYTGYVKEGVKQLQKFLNGADFNRSLLPASAGTSLTANGVYDRKTYLWLKTYLDQASAFIKIDIWWYAMNGRDWDEYVAAVVGLPIKMKAATGDGITTNPNNKNSVQTPQWVVDDKGLQTEVGEWQKKFVRSVRNIGNYAVDDSINKATARSANVGIADPRIQPGDVIWCMVPGYIGPGTSPPYKNGIYVTSISRTMDLTAGTYIATYSGYRFRGEFGLGMDMNLNLGFGFIAHGL